MSMQKIFIVYLLLVCVLGNVGATSMLVSHDFGHHINHDCCNNQVIYENVNQQSPGDCIEHCVGKSNEGSILYKFHILEKKIILGVSYFTYDPFHYIPYDILSDYNWYAQSPPVFGMSPYHSIIGTVLLLV